MKMKKIGLTIAMLMLGVFLASGTANATLLGVELGFPDITSNSTGTYVYYADRQLMVMTGMPLIINMGGGDLGQFALGGTYSAQFHVDNSGNFTGGIDGPDLVINGDLLYHGTHYVGDILLGEVTNFGWQDTSGAGSGPCLFDFTFDIVGGKEQFFTVGGKGVNFTTVENGTMADNWEETHWGTPVKHDTTATNPVPEPSTMALLGMGILGLFGLGKKKF